MEQRIKELLKQKENEYKQIALQIQQLQTQINRLLQEALRIEGELRVLQRLDGQSDKEELKDAKDRNHVRKGRS